MGETVDITRFEDDGSYWVACWNCGGAGEHVDDCVCHAFEDCCMCLEPEPPVCRECRGAGELHVKSKEPTNAD